MNLLYLHLDIRQASYRYRVEQFKPFWAATPHTVDYQAIVGLSALQKVQSVLNTRRYDWVILQKKLLHPLFIRAITKRSRLVFDFDDALYARESYKKEKPRSVDPGSATARRRLDYILRAADMVWAGSDELAAYSRAKNPRTLLIPTALPPVTPDNGTRKARPLRVGWLGNTYNLFYLKEIDENLNRVAQRHAGRIEFHLMSARIPDNYFRVPWIVTPWGPDREAAWLRSIDVGLMPLRNDAWSRGKCAFKLLQYARYGKALVASKVGANTAVVQHGINGYLIDEAFDWEQALSALVEAPESVARFGVAARAHFLKHYEVSAIFRRIRDYLENPNTESK
ncbi:MAG: glycosyltransferase [Calditrichaeota bacterium]|nr:MAG: glycosyltransferase [Calditrichota bacterium]